MGFSRQAPSTRYRALLEQYTLLHASGESKLGLTPEETYPGVSLIPHAPVIRDLIKETSATSILDYGCGKGIAYELSPITIPGVGKVETLLDYWDVDRVHCYDPCYPPYTALPEATFSGVICTDVLEHCPEEDIPWIVGELFGYAERFVFASIACFPALSHLPNGENAHLTIREPAWWQAVFASAASVRPAVQWRILTESLGADATPGRFLEHQFGTV